jgi:hypothetical protein
MALALALVGALGVSGCYGRFALTNKLHAWNGTVSDRWINSLLFFGLVIVQAYSICLLGDGLIFNTVEFWSGSNPVSRVDPDGTVHIVKDGQSFELVPAGDNKWNVVKDGEIVAVASRTADGSLALSDVASERTTVIASGQLSELAETAPSALAVAPAQ